MTADDDPFDGLYTPEELAAREQTAKFEAWIRKRFSCVGRRAEAGSCLDEEPSMEVADRINWAAQVAVADLAKRLADAEQTRLGNIAAAGEGLAWVRDLDEGLARAVAVVLEHGVEVGLRRALEIVERASIGECGAMRWRLDQLADEFRAALRGDARPARSAGGTGSAGQDSGGDACSG